MGLCYSIQEKVSQSIDLDLCSPYKPNPNGHCGQGKQPWCGKGRYCSCYGWCGPEKTHKRKWCLRHRRNANDQYSYNHMPANIKKKCHLLNETTDLEEFSEFE